MTRISGHARRCSAGARRRSARQAALRAERRRLGFETLEDRHLLAGTHIEIQAAGQTGTESMRLLVDGATIATWTNVGGSTSSGVFQTFAADLPNEVTIDRVRVAFVNDANVPGVGDRNLMVNSVKLNNLAYDTRAANVYSTGTWQPTIGVTPGYKQSPWLHVNGYFQYGTLPSTVDVLAAGKLGQERIELRINNVTVATYDVTGGDYAAGSSYQKFSYTHTSPLSANEIKVQYVNDAVVAEGDRNVRIDAIVLDKVKNETEAPGVLTTGTTGYGGVPQFLQTEKMFINGYFQYGDNRVTAPPPPQGTDVTIRAAGSIGDEIMELRIAGATVATFTNVGGNAGAGTFNTFLYHSPVNVTADQISVALTNDQGIASYDRNLRVDSITVGATTYQTEAADTYSTGTYTLGIGIKPGYWRSEWLHGNGEFRYSRPGTPGTLALQTSLLSVSESAGTVSIPVIRTGGSDGTVGIQYTTVPASATANVDYSTDFGTLVFNPGETLKTIVVPILDDGSDEPDETFNLATDLVLGGAVLGQPRTATITIVDDDGPPPLASGNGLHATYYNGENLEEPVFERTDPIIDFDWDFDSPGPGVNADSFSVLWTGQIEAVTTETYTFRTGTDDGVELWIDGVKIIDAYYEQPYGLNEGSIDLVAGQKYDIVMKYFDHVGYASAELRWTTPSTYYELVPQSQLYSSAPQAPADGTFTLETVVTGLFNPTAMDFDASGRMFVSEQPGTVRVVQNGQLLPTPFLDIRERVNFVQDRGMIGIAVHPNFPATPYVYVSYVYDPPETANFSGNAGRDGAGNRISRVSRFTADPATGFNTAIPGSEVVLIGGAGDWNTISHPELDSTNDITIPATGGPDGSAQNVLIIDSLTHAVGNIIFGPDGMLYVANGDGASFGRVDPRAVRVQNLDSLSGKVLRVDPITGQGLATNPFFNGDVNANRSKVVDYGLRNPFRFAFQPGTGELFVGDVGWNTHEEINIGQAQNYGWPYYEGVQGQNSPTGGYNALPTAAAFYADNSAVPPLWSRSHASGAVALVLGDFYTGGVYPQQFDGTLFFADYGDSQIRYMTLNPDNSLHSVTLLNLTSGPIVEMSMGRDGYMYYVDITGKIGRLAYAPPAAATLASEGIAGDFNGDAAVDGSDFLAWQRGVAALEPAVASEQLSDWQTNYGLDAEVAWLALAAPTDGEEPLDAGGDDEGAALFSVSAAQVDEALASWDDEPALETLSQESPVEETFDLFGADAGLTTALDAF